MRDGNVARKDARRVKSLNLPESVGECPFRHNFFMQCKNLMLQAYTDLRMQGILLNMHAAEIASIICLRLSACKCDPHATFADTSCPIAYRFRHMPRIASSVLCLAAKYVDRQLIDRIPIHEWESTACKLNGDIWIAEDFPAYGVRSLTSCTPLSHTCFL
jgi:hypothetical protein